MNDKILLLETSNFNPCNHLRSYYSSENSVCTIKVSNVKKKNKAIMSSPGGTDLALFETQEALKTNLSELVNRLFRQKNDYESLVYFFARAFDRGVTEEKLDSLFFLLKASAKESNLEELTQQIDEIKTSFNQFNIDLRDVEAAQAVQASIIRYAFRQTNVSFGSLRNVPSPLSDDSSRVERRNSSVNEEKKEMDSLSHSANSTSVRSGSTNVSSVTTDSINDIASLALNSNHLTVLQEYVSKFDDTEIEEWHREFAKAFNEGTDEKTINLNSSLTEKLVKSPPENDERLTTFLDECEDEKKKARYYLTALKENMLGGVCNDDNTKNDELSWLTPQLLIGNSAVLDDSNVEENDQTCSSKQSSVTTGGTADNVTDISEEGTEYGSV